MQLLRPRFIRPVSGYTEKDLIVLVELGIGGERRPRDLRRVLGLNRDTMGHRLRRLLDAGVVENEKAPWIDKQAVLYSLTGSGVDAIADLDRKLADTETRARANVNGRAVRRERLAKR